MSHGGKRPGAGRPKGAKDRISRGVKEDVLEVFEKLGGVDAMAKWAENNKRDFYTIWARLLPKSVEGDFRHTHDKSADEMTDAELMEVINGKSSEAA